MTETTECKTDMDMGNHLIAAALQGSTHSMIFNFWRVRYATKKKMIKYPQLVSNGDTIIKRKSNRRVVA